MRTWMTAGLILAGLSTQGADPPPGGDAAPIFAGPIEQVATGFRFTEGPVWLPTGTLLFSDIPANCIYALARDDTTTVWRADSGQANGLTLDPEGRLIACEHGNRRVSLTRKDGAIESLAETWEGARLNSPNDAVVRADGLVFFTDPPYGLAGRTREIPFQGVYRVRPGEAPVCIARDFSKPNGIALAPDQKTLYVADTDAGHVRAFALADDGSLAEGRVLGTMPTPDGMAVDLQGRLFVTSREGIVVLGAEGRREAVLPCPEVPANCTFGGVDGRMLYITARRSLYRVRTVLPGLPAPPSRRPL